MNESVRALRLSKRERDYLLNTQFLTAEMREKILAAAPDCAGEFVLHTSTELAEEFGDVLTIRLAECGFDKNYEPTREGSLLENLISKLVE